MVSIELHSPSKRTFEKERDIKEISIMFEYLNYFSRLRKHAQHKCLTLCNILAISDNEPRADLVRPCATTLTQHSHQGKTARLEQLYLKR